MVANKLPACKVWAKLVHKHQSYIFKGHCGLYLAFDCKGRSSHFDPEGPDQLWVRSSDKLVTNNNEFQQKSKPTGEEGEEGREDQPGGW